MEEKVHFNVSLGLKLHNKLARLAGENEVSLNAQIQDILETHTSAVRFAEEKLSANYAFELAKLSILNKSEQLLTSCYEAIENAAKNGRMEATVSTDFTEYNDIPEDVKKHLIGPVQATLTEQGYVVSLSSSSLKTGGKPYSQTYLHINFDPEFEPLPF